MQRNPKFSLANDFNAQITGAADLVVRNTRRKGLKRNNSTGFNKHLLKKAGQPYL